MAPESDQSSSTTGFGSGPKNDSVAPPSTPPQIDTNRRGWRDSGWSSDENRTVSTDPRLFGVGRDSDSDSLSDVLLIRVKIKGGKSSRCKK